MKSVFALTMHMPDGTMRGFNVIATSMTEAITKAQTAAGVATDPETFQRLAQIDVE
jgi:hypothetical protein